MNANEITASPQSQLAPAVLSAIQAQVSDATRQADKLRASALAIDLADDDPAMVEIAGNELRELATIGKRLDERRLDFTRPIDATKAYVKGLFDAPAAILAEGEAHLRAQLQASLKRQQERERAERERLEEQQRQERAAAEAREREARERLAAEATPEAEAEVQAAAEAAEIAEIATAPAVIPAAKPKGISTRERWVVGEIDLAALVKAAAADPALLIYLEPNTKRLGQFATMMGAEAKVPGVTFETDTILSARRK